MENPQRLICTALLASVLETSTAHSERILAYDPPNPDWVMNRFSGLRMWSGMSVVLRDLQGLFDVLDWFGLTVGGYGKFRLITERKKGAPCYL